MIRRFAVALLLAAPMPALAQLRPSAPEAVADAVADCWAAVGAGAVDKAALARTGWTAGSIRAGGRAVDTPLEVYGKTGSNVVLMLMGTAKSPACSVMARARSPSDLGTAAEAIQRRLTRIDPQVKTARSGNSIVFLSLPRLAMLDATGSTAEPALRVAVTFNGGGK